MLYGRFTGLVFSLFLPAFYRAVARNWGGIGLLYLLLLFTLTWIPILAKWQLGFQRTVGTEFAKVAHKIPEVQLQGGQISSPVEQPYEVKDETGKLIFVLDTTGKIKNLDQTPAMILLTKTHLHQRDQARVQITDLSQFPWDIDFSADVVKEWIDFVGTWLGVGLYPLMMILSLIRALIIMLIASVAGLIFNAIFNARVSYGGLLRFGAVGMTLSVYIDTAMMLLDIQIPFYFVIALALTIFYVAFGTIVSIPPVVNLDYDPEREPEEGDQPRRDPHTGIKSAPDY
jgi:Protein of unknown function (DUF1189)